MRKILVADDDEMLLESVKYFLEEKGLTVFVLSSIRKISQTIKEQKPDLIVLDLYFPDGRGGQVCCDLKVNKEAKKIPVLLISSHDNLKKIACDVKADDYLRKPFEVEELYKKIQTNLNVPLNS